MSLPCTHSAARRPSHTHTAAIVVPSIQGQVYGVSTE